LTSTGAAVCTAVPPDAESLNHSRIVAAKPIEIADM
jgi:hypothetical protein